MAEHTTRLLGERFAVVDVETSGLRADRHRVLQLGIVVVDADGTVLDTYSTLVSGSNPWQRWFGSVGPTHIHGIRRRDLRGAPSTHVALTELARRLEGTRFVAHNAPFDLGFLQAEARRVGTTLPIERALCTLRLSRLLDPDRQQSHRLGDLCSRYGITIDRPHDALADAEATAALLPHLLRAHGVHDTADLDRLPGVDPQGSSRS
ncbi:MAG: exonuclease domain-containing protein [Ilumatobacteraceae bacterium]